MARLVTTGFELNDPAQGNAHPDGNVIGYDASVKRTGAFSSSIVSGLAQLVGITIRAAAQANNVKTFARIYFRFTSLPASTCTIISLSGSTFAVKIDSTGTLQLFNGITQIGSNGPTLSIDTWYCVEIGGSQSSVANSGYLEGRLNGVSFASATGIEMGAPSMTTAAHGPWAGPQAGRTGYWDDLAVNDDVGADENSWPGLSGGVYLLKPISDANVGTWTGGAGGITNLFDAVNNTPPIGTATETNLTQIENADTTPDNATDEYRPNLTSYTTAGVPAGTTITVCTAFCNHGEDVATGTKTGKFRIETNPAQTAYDTFTFGADAGALATYPTTWTWTKGTPFYPGGTQPTLGTSPTLAMRKTDTGNRVGSVDALYMYVDTRAALTPSLIADTRRVRRNMLLRR